jgi:hypothetical protein
MTSEERLEACRAWVQAVLNYGDDLSLVFHPPWMDNGSVGIHRSFGYANTAQPRPPLNTDFTRDELFAILQPLGKVRDLRDKMPWHFKMPWHYSGLKDVSPSKIAGARLKEARRVLGLDVEAFYAPAGMLKKTALKWEAGDIASRFISFGDRRFEALSEAHSIPLWWLLATDLFEARFNAAQTSKEAAAS